MTVAPPPAPLTKRSASAAPRVDEALPASESVQRPPRHQDLNTRRRQRESLLLFLVFGGAFFALGYWVVTQLHVVPFDALDRVTRAMMVWHNDPPKLAAIGGAFPPITTVALLPLLIFSAVGSSLIAVPLSAAAFGGFTMVWLNRILQRASVHPVLRYVMLVLIAVNPVVAFAASTGGDLIGVMFMTIAMVALVGWFAAVDTRFLVTGGIAWALACLSDYTFLPWTLVAALMVAVTLARHRAAGEEIEGSLILFLVPVSISVALWTLFHWVVFGTPFGWLTDGGATTVNAASSAPVSATLEEVAVQTLELLVAAAPIAFIILPALLACAILQRNEMAAWLAAFMLVAIATPALRALERGDLSELTLQAALPVLIVSVIAAAWLCYSLEHLRGVAIGLTLAVLAVSIPLAWNALEKYPYQSMEQAFRAAIVTGEDQEGTSSRGGLEVGILSERAMAEFLEREPGRVLTDNAQTFGVIALTGSPDRFLDRADEGDAAWRGAVSKLPSDVDYLLFATNASGDELRRAYPEAAAGSDPRFVTVFDTPRYRLVAPRTQPDATTEAQP